MKKVFLIVFLLMALVNTINAQNYERQQCPVCKGNGAVFSGYYDYYGNPIVYQCQNCGGYGFVLIPTSGDVVFKGDRVVELKSASGGKSYGYGTFYFGGDQKFVIYENRKLIVTDFDVSGWKYMIMFTNGDKWYFR